MYYLAPEKATVCSENNCITVYGRTAQTVNTIVVAVALLIGFSLLVKVSQ